MTYAQVGIGTVTPNNSAILDVDSSDKGLLPPRMTNVQKNNIINPATGLMVYDTTNKCTSVNIGSPGVPNWECLNEVDNTTIPSVIVSDSALTLNESTSWVDVPDLTRTFTILEEETVRMDWTLFVGQNNSSTSDGFAQMFTILDINGVNDPDSSNYLPMIHSPGGNSFRLLMNNSTFSHTIALPPGTYTIKVKVYVASFLGSTNAIKLGHRTTGWAGSSGMTNDERRNAASNKLIISFL
ncbi:hypothetical protein C1H87_22625 [Flavivirga eckloniae]|uniref:Uncharacterized protein n=2 Tax=Flavivirga eckloniae TaxID=1803846 RepID=A0A2K9PWB7_9FLAO|nr:hypothetical protein C1H87_22625 [Flavivirga eckloniae]